jgi:prolyl-tRNA editing enzyme YbaK/EbsC (Cys-tRNA(Pro) deacylase)
MINGGQRGVMIKMAPGDMIDALKVQIADLSA